MYILDDYENTQNMYIKKESGIFIWLKHGIYVSSVKLPIIKGTKYLSSTKPSLNISLFLSPCKLLGVILRGLLI